MVHPYVGGVMQSNFCFTKRCKNWRKKYTFRSLLCQLTFYFLKIKGPKRSHLDNFWGYLTKQNMFKSTPPIWGWTMDASFPLIFGFSGLSNAQSQQWQISKPIAFHSEKSIFKYWHKRLALQSVAVRRSTGNYVSGPLFSQLFFQFSIFSPFFSSIFSPSRPFLIEGVLGSKNLFSKSWQERPKT